MIILEITIPLVCLALLEVFAAIPFAYALLAMERQFVCLGKTNPHRAKVLILFEAVVCLGVLLSFTYWMAAAWSSYLRLGGY